MGVILKMNNISIGKFGEEFSINYLIKNKYKILEKNYRCKYGEIDIIAFKQNILVFFEVKSRKNTNFGYPSESITKTKKEHIYNVATYYLMNNKINYDEIRLDAIEVYITKNKVYLNHIEDIIN